MVDDFAKTLGENIMNALLKAKAGKKADAPNAMTPNQYSKALSGIGLELERASKYGPVGANKASAKIYENSITWSGSLYDVDLSMNKPDVAVLNHFQKEYFPPTFKRLTVGETPYNYKNTIDKILTKAVDNHWNWNKIIREMESFVNVKGKNFPRWMYQRIVTTEVSRYVIEGHIRGHIKMGFTHFRRLVTEDDVTNVDLCLPFNNYIYEAKYASGVVPAHSSCRCDITPEPNNAKSLGLWNTFVTTVNLGAVA